MKRAIITIGFAMLVIALFCHCASVRAEQIKIALTGYVNNVSDSYNLLGGSIHNGDAITGYYIYDSATADSDSSAVFGSYKYTITPYGMSITIGSTTFKTDSTNVNFEVGLINNYAGETLDSYEITSYNNFQLVNGVSVGQLHWQLDDYTGTALSSDALLLTAPDLTKWQDNSMSVFGGTDAKTQFVIRGYITSAYLVPEPMTLFLLGLGGLLLRRRH